MTPSRPIPANHDLKNERRKLPFRPIGGVCCKDKRFAMASWEQGLLSVCRQRSNRLVNIILYHSDIPEEPQK